MTKRNCCDMCDDGSGTSVYPYYGVAPHTHDTTNGIIGSTRVLPASKWGDNFVEDAEGPGHGTYTRCPNCGAGDPS